MLLYCSVGTMSQNMYSAKYHASKLNSSADKAFTDGVNTNLGYTTDVKTWLFFSASLLCVGFMVMLFVGGLHIETSRTDRALVESDVHPTTNYVPSPELTTTTPSESEIGTPVIEDVPTTSLPSSTKPMPEKPKPTPAPTTPVKPTPATPKPPVTSEPKPTPTPEPPTPAPTPAPVATKLKWGVFTGSNPASVAEFERKVDANPDYLAYFIHWANDRGAFPAWLHGVAADKGRTLIIFWEASDFIIGGTNQPDYAYSRILAGDHDDYIRQFASQLKDYGDRIILIPFSEWNGNWTPWSGTKNGNTPQEAVEAYRYVHGFFDDAPNVSFGIAFNAASVPSTPENQIPRYYPGDEYVDYIGLDGFNMGYGTYGWETFDELFAPGLRTLAQYGKPTLLFSFASAEGPRSKADWLNDALNVQLPKYPHVIGFVYFNQNKERNWLLWSDEETFKVFTDYVEE